MIPKTEIQLKVTELAKKMPSLSVNQLNHAYTCIDKLAYVTSKRTACLSCGQLMQTPINIGNKVKCTGCNSILKVVKTKYLKNSQEETYAIITRVKTFQVIRFFKISSTERVGSKAIISLKEIIQHWISPNGNIEMYGLIQTFSFYSTSFTGNMELRNIKNFNKYNFIPKKVYPKKNIIPELKRAGFKGQNLNLSYAKFCKLLLTNPKVETLLKSNQTSLLKYAVTYYIADIEKHWNTLKICIRHNYKIDDVNLYIDYLSFLKDLDKDLKNPKNVCPLNLNLAHHETMILRNKKNQKQLDIERKKSYYDAINNTDVNLECFLEEQEAYALAKTPYFNLKFEDKELKIEVFKTVKDIYNEGIILQHCVYSKEYYKNEKSLLLSATVNGTPIETVEFDLDKMIIVQSRGYKNNSSAYNKLIDNLINKNINRIIKCRNKIAS